MAQLFRYPTSNVSLPAIGSNGAPIPAFSIQVGGEDPSGDLLPLRVNASGEVIADVSGSVAGLALESTLQSVLADTTAIAAIDFATETTLANVDSSLANVDTSLQALLDSQSDDGQPLTSTKGLVIMGEDAGTANILNVNAAGAILAAQSGTWSINLPTGAATEAKQDVGNADLATIASAVSGTEMQVDIVAPLPAGTNNIGTVDVDGITFAAAQSAPAPSEFAVIAAIDNGGDTQHLRTDASGALWITNNGSNLDVDAFQAGTWDINNISGTISLPTGAATEAKQDTGNTSLATIAGAVSGSEMQVDVVSSALPTGAATEAKQDSIITAINSLASSSSSRPSSSSPEVYHDYSVTPVTTSTPVAVTTGAPIANDGSVVSLEIFDSSGQMLTLSVNDGTNPPVELLNIFPGGNGLIQLKVDVPGLLGTVDFEVQAVTATANVGFLAINVYSV